MVDDIVEIKCVLAWHIYLLSCDARRNVEAMKLLSVLRYDVVDMKNYDAERRAKWGHSKTNATRKQWSGGSERLGMYANTCYYSENLK